MSRTTTPSTALSDRGARNGDRDECEGLPFGHSPLPTSELSGSSRPNEPNFLRRQRVANEDLENERYFFHSRYESKPSGGFRRLLVVERRTVGELLSDMELDGYHYAFTTHAGTTYLPRRRGRDYDQERQGPRNVQQGRTFALRDYDSDLEHCSSPSSRSSSEREGARRLAEVRAFFTGDENPIFRGLKLLDTERKLQSKQSLFNVTLITNEEADIGAPSDFTIAKFNDVDLDTVDFNDLENEWTRGQRGSYYGERFH